jgi:hypothetical protein
MIMKTRTRIGLEILQAATVIGVLGNILLRQTPWGLNAFLFVVAFVAALLMLMRRRRPELLTMATIALTAAMVFFASMFLIRDSIELRIYDTIAILIIMGVVLLVNLDIKANVAGAFHYVVGFIWSGFTSLVGPLFLLGSDIEWKAMPGNRLSRYLFAVLRGLAIALPLVLIFGALFMAADAVFEGFVNRVINFDLETIISHVLLTSLFAWLTAGYFRGAMASSVFPSAGAAAAAAAATSATEPSPKEASAPEKKDDSSTSFVAKVAAEPGEQPATLPDNLSILEHINRSDPPNETNVEKTTDGGSNAEATLPGKKIDFQNFDNTMMPSGFTLGTIETVIILGLVDLLFLGFVVVQVQYLFGGMELVQNTPDFKLADYARRGFGELVAVSALVLPILLVSHWLLRKENGRLEGIFKILAGLQIALLFVIMASAVQRLVLLTGELGYGLTTVRFYPMVFMIWLAVVFGWFALTVFRGARKHFAWGALWSAIVILGATNLLNPDAFIVRTNLDLMHQGREFDANYNAGLSDDSVPILIEALPAMNSVDRCSVTTRLYNRMVEANEERDLRSWSLSRSTARYALAGSIPPTAEEATAKGCPGLNPSPVLRH